ncbi:MAG: hypothetical protein V1711_00190 [bacterium]
MITDTDITKLKSVFATKGELSELRADMKAGFAEVNERFTEVNERFDGVNERIDTVSERIDTVALAVGRIENTLDGIAGAIQDLRTENGAGAAHLSRHDRQIEVLSFATKVVLPN